MDIKSRGGPHPPNMKQKPGRKRKTSQATRIGLKKLCSRHPHATDAELAEILCIAIDFLKFPHVSFVPTPYLAARYFFPLRKLGSL